MKTIILLISLLIAGSAWAGCEPPLFWPEEHYNTYCICAHKNVFEHLKFSYAGDAASDVRILKFNRPHTQLHVITGTMDGINSWLETNPDWKLDRWECYANCDRTFSSGVTYHPYQLPQFRVYLQKEVRE